MIVRIEPDDQPIPIQKIDEERRIAFGWASVSIRCSGEKIRDYQDHVIEPEDLEDAAYEFNLSYHGAAYGEDHIGDVKGRLVESFVSTPEKLEAMGLAKNALPCGWWIGVRVDDDEAWENVKKGKIKMFSIQGTAVLERA